MFGGTGALSGEHPPDNKHASMIEYMIFLIVRIFRKAKKRTGNYAFCAWEQHLVNQPDDLTARKQIGTHTIHLCSVSMNIIRGKSDLLHPAQLAFLIDC